jgi:hypothetical protein
MSAFESAANNTSSTRRGRGAAKDAGVALSPAPAVASTSVTSPLATYQSGGFSVVSSNIEEWLRKLSSDTNYLAKSVDTLGGKHDNADTRKQM